MQATHQKLKEASKDCPKGFQGSVALPKPWLGTFSQQTCETINFCYYEPLGLRAFVRAALGNSYTMKGNF